MSKGLEALERLRNTLLAEGYYQDMLQDVSIIEKELKALEIIKKYFYNGGCLFGEMSKQEFNFIKEVLSNGQ